MVIREFAELDHVEMLPQRVCQGHWQNVYREGGLSKR